MSAESGIPTFRAVDGLWENHRVEDVASPEGWKRNPAMVLEFYNQRRKQVLEASPNRGHEILASLETHFDVRIITQNIDNLHERAGSSKVLHLHGEITKSRSTQNSFLVYNIEGWELKMGDRCELGSQLRPHIVWFGEEVPLIEQAALLTMEADILVVVGTSLQVYPAAGLIRYASPSIPRYIIDPNIPDVHGIGNFNSIEEGAGRGLELLAEQILKS